MKISGIYKIINKTNGKYYVGSSVNLSQRIYSHRSALNNSRHYNEHLQKAWNKYGKENFEFLIIESNISNDDLFLTEQKYLNVAKAEKDRCYNASFIANRVEMTPETIKKISKINSGKGNPNFGKHTSEEAKQKMREKRKFWHPRAEVCQKHSDDMKGSKNPFFGKCHSEEAKRKMSEKHKGKPNILLRDSTIITFHNEITNETFIGTKYDLKEKYKLRHVSDIVSGKRNITKGWVVIR